MRLVDNCPDHQMPRFYRGVTRECFHAVGKTLVIIQVFMMHAKYGVMTGKASLKNLYEISSGPHEMVFFDCFILTTTVAAATGCGLNTSALRVLVGV